MLLNDIKSDPLININSESLVDIKSAPDFKPFAFNSTNKHVHSHPNFDAPLDPGIHTDTHCIKVSLIDINSESDVKPYVFCTTNSYLHDHSDNVSHVDINSAPDSKPFVL